MDTNKKLIVANWKMKPTKTEKAERLLEDYSGIPDLPVDVVICPPFVWLEKGVQKCKENKAISVGAQDVFWENPESGGAYTGEVSANMLFDLGVEYVIVGHSERREIIGESNEVIKKKTLTALGAGLKVILCVGEPWKEREKGIDVARDYVKSQIDAVFDGLSISASDGGISLAYEPIWAISTSENQRDETPEDASDMVEYIKEHIKKMYGHENLKVLYGGSVDRSDAGSFICLPEVDGVLVGSASLKPEEFSNIMKTICNT